MGAGAGFTVFNKLLVLCTKADFSVLGWSPDFLVGSVSLRANTASRASSSLFSLLSAGRGPEKDPAGPLYWFLAVGSADCSVYLRHSADISAVMQLQ